MGVLSQKMIFSVNIHYSFALQRVRHLPLDVLHHRTTVQHLINFVRTLGAFVLAFFFILLCSIAIRLRSCWPKLDSGITFQFVCHLSKEMAVGT